MKIYDVFLSYRRSDGFNLAYEIYKYLTVKGLRVFLDKEKMEDGHYFTTQIVKYLQQSPNYILVATPDGSSNLQKEGRNAESAECFIAGDSQYGEVYSRVSADH